MGVRGADAVVPRAIILGFAVFLLILGLMEAMAREERRDPITGRIRILYTGDPVPGSPYPVFTRDPMTDVTPVIASGFNFPASTIRRYMRLYMPRTDKGLYEGYDVIIISDAGIPFFTDKQLNSFRSGVLEFGMAFIMIGGYEAFGGNIALGSWGPTPVQEVMPVECLTDKWESRYGQLVVDGVENPLMQSLPFDEMGANGVFYGCNIVEVKQGSSKLASYDVTTSSYVHPLLIYWEVGKGSSFAMTADWTPAGGVDFLRWQYYGDYALNVVTYVIGGKLPDDPALTYQVRQLMANYRNFRQTLDALIEFASKFGANMVPVERMIGDAEDAKAVAEESYIDAEMETSIEQFRAAIEVLDSASERAYELKDEALFWVYVTEWMVVSATGMICGFILWTVMVKRKMYQEVALTRLARLEE